MRPEGGAGPGRPVSRLLIGRDDVLTRLRGQLDHAVHTERLTTVLVEGPAGIGKTRLVHELAGHVDGVAADVLVGHCVASGDHTLPFAPLVDLLAELTRREGAAAVRRWAGPAGAELGRLVPALATEDDLAAGPSGPARLFQAVSRLVTEASARRPLVLVVEDVHWSDTSTRDLLALLASQQRGAVLLVLTLRTDESPVPAGLSRYLAELVRDGSRRLSLTPLRRDEQARQISEICGVPPTRELLDEVYARAEGNPFFAEELLALRRHGGGDGLPVTVRDLLLARVESLSPLTRQVLRSASLVGRDVPLPLLERVADVTGSRLDEALREAVSAHVLRPRGRLLSFRHALLQESVATGLLPGEAGRTHRRLAEALTDDPHLAEGAFGRVAGRVAHHWDLGGVPDRALVASVAAGREAADALAFAEALDHFERALELLTTVPDADALLGVERSRLLRWTAEAAHLAAHPDRATALVRQAIATTDPADVHLRGWLHERLGRYLWMAGDGQGALAAYRTAVDLVPAEPPSRPRAAVLSGLSQILMLADRCAESEEHARAALAVTARLPDARSIEGHARCNLGVDLAARGEYDAGVAELELARRIADEEMTDVDENARALVNLASTQLLYGRLEEAAATAEESVRVGDALGLRRRKGIWCRCDAATAQLLLGRFATAEAHLREARDLVPTGIDAIRVDLVQGQLRLRQGRLDDATGLLAAARKAGDQLVDPQLLGPLFEALADTALGLGDPEHAGALVVEGLDRMPPGPGSTYAVGLLRAGVSALVARPDPLPDEARTLLTRAEDSAAALRGRSAAVTAELATAHAEVDGDADSWRAATQAWDAVGDRYRAAGTRVRAAAALLAGGGDRTDAARLLDQAAADADAIGAAGVLDQVASLGRRARLRRPTEGPGGAYRLTRRELDVLALVAEGLTDRVIGERLFISHRTVERHVSNLLAKLDARRRSELVATALREGLAGPS